MPQPKNSEVHVNKPLTNLSLAFMQDMNGFVSRKVFPVVPVEHRSDLYYVYEKGQWFRSDVQKRASCTESAGTGFNLTTDNYSVCDFAVHMDVCDKIRGNTDPAINLDADATELVTRQIMMQMELAWAADYFATGIWTGGTAPDPVPGIKWDAVNSTPFQDMEDQLLATMKLCGFRPNTAVMGAEVWSVLKHHPEALDRIKYTQTGLVTPDLFASALGLDRILVANALTNTANEGATPVIDFVHNDSVLMAYSAPRPGLMTPTAGYTFAWSGMAGANSAGMRMKRFRMEALSADRVEGETAYDHKLVASDLGVFLNDVLT